jgi:hypothetical protein
MENFFSTLIASLISGTVLSTILGFFFLSRSKRIEAEIKSNYDKNMAIFQSNRSWKEKSVSELLGPLYIQFDRTNRAFNRLKEQNLFLEAKVIKEGNTAIRDLLLTKSYLIPPELWEDAGNLIEHYDRWLEEFYKVRSEEKPDLETKFVFVGPKGFPFPKKSEEAFKKKFRIMWSELYENDELNKR